eukprot:COSAG01_NODE_52125_length_349_cov_0.620000_1_plen_43_part_10
MRESATLLAHLPRAAMFAKQLHLGLCPTSQRGGGRRTAGADLN